MCFDSMHKHPCLCLINYYIIDLMISWSFKAVSILAIFKPFSGNVVLLIYFCLSSISFTYSQFRRNLILNHRNVYILVDKSVWYM